MEIYAQDVEGLLLATLLGAIIGIDREYRGKPAGFRTLMLVSMGAALFAIVSFRMAMNDPRGVSDVTRIASNIVVGVGFLGAGIIFRTSQDVRGLTTSATVWIAAAIGMTAGMGSFFLAIVGTVITWLTLFVLHYVENAAEAMSGTEKYTLSWKAQTTLPLCEEYFEGRSFDLKEKKLRKKGDLIIAEWTIRASRSSHEYAIARMLTDPRIVELEH